MTAAHHAIDLSDRRRVLIAGDIHGEFGLLREELERHGFDPEADALVLVGDIADHGPQSHHAIDWISQPWVHRVRGDHCEMPAMFAEGALPKDLFEDQGGDWYVGLPPKRLKAIADALANAPAALTVTTPAGRRIGITHADCLNDWNLQIDAIAPGSTWRTWALDLATWTPRTLHALEAARKNGEQVNPGKVRVHGVDHVFHGHTVFGSPRTIANRTWLDTGAYHTGNLAVIDADQWIDSVNSSQKTLVQGLEDMEPDREIG